LSVLKNLDIDLPQSERKTLISFLSLYIFFVVIILAFTSFMYYGSQKELKIQEKKLLLNEYANEFITKLENINIQKNNQYPKDKSFTTAVYNSEYKLIHSTMLNPHKSLEDVVYTDNFAIRYIKNPKLYYLDTQYVVIKIIEDNKWLNNTIKTIMIFGTIAFIFMLIIGYFLLKLFLKPMRDSIELLDTFIKDTTHELNTPVSTIVANIEMIDIDKIEDEKLIKKINRIDIGAKTISNIYNDLTYLILNNKIISHNTMVHLKYIIQQRIEYFQTLSKIKKITIFSELDDDVILYIDEKKISKLIDNIISNAIKYNKMGGTIEIKLTKEYLSIKDSGIGISDENISLLFDRYSRFNNSVGGFGIGLNIVKMICDEYNLDIKVKSKLEKYTNIIISW